MVTFFGLCGVTDAAPAQLPPFAFCNEQPGRKAWTRGAFVASQHRVANLNACATFIRLQCTIAKYVSFSKQNDECAWYTRCDGIILNPQGGVVSDYISMSLAESWDNKVHEEKASTSSLPGPQHSSHPQWATIQNLGVRLDDLPAPRQGPTTDLGARSSQWRDPEVAAVMRHLAIVNASEQEGEEINLPTRMAYGMAGLPSGDANQGPENAPLAALGALTMEVYFDRRVIGRLTMGKRGRGLLGDAFHFRYLLSQKKGIRPGNTDKIIARENRTFGDLLRLQTREGPDRCWVKMLLWMRFALSKWPIVSYVGICDDDVFIQIERVAAELSMLSARGVRRVYWGQPLWMSYWNYSNFIGEGFGGYSENGDNEAIDGYYAELEHQGLRHNVLEKEQGRRHICAATSSNRATASMRVASGPFVFMNTDLVFLSSDLVHEALKGRCLAEFSKRLHDARRDGSWTPSGNQPCEPMIDQLLGWFVLRSPNVTIVEIKIGQGHPWPTFSYKQAGEHSLYVHKLYGSDEDPWAWRYFDAALSQSYVPMQRVCGPCVGFTAVQGEPPLVSTRNPNAHRYQGWRCCLQKNLPPQELEEVQADLCAKQRAAQRHDQMRRCSRSGCPFKQGAQFDGACAIDEQGEQAGTCKNSTQQTAGSLMIDAEGIESLDDCVRACERCSACQFVSYSESHYIRVCRWHSTCDLLHLKLGTSSELCPTYTTVQVKASSGAQSS